jgi:CHAT domain-containing protein
LKKYNKIQVVILFLFGCCLFFNNFSQASPVQDDVHLSKWTEQLLAQGKFDQAIRHLEIVLQSDAVNPNERVDILIRLSATYQALGLSEKAKIPLLQALTLSQITPLQQALVFASLSDIALATQQDEEARKYIDKSMAILPKDASPLIKASISNNLANVLNVEAYYDQAIDQYKISETLAKEGGDKILEVRVLLNIVQTAFKNSQLSLIINNLYAAHQQLNTMTDEYTKAFHLISVAELGLRFQKVFPDSYQKADKMRAIIFDSLKSALSIAESLKNNRLISYANGCLGQLYEIEKQFSDALYLTRQAIFFAQQENSIDVLYRWQWQLGRLFSAQNNMPESIESYRQAIDSLQKIRHELTIGYRSVSSSFRERLGPVYFELADLLLQRAGIDKENQAQWLREARDTLERFKTAELQDYFEDDCVAASRSEFTFSEAKISGTAVIYPILLANRLEILLELSSHIQRFTVPISDTQIKDEVNEFRFELETRNTEDFLIYAQHLYQWLIAPLESTLQAEKIDTLVFVPDGVLRTIPLAALHDGNRFLIDRYAIAVSPSLTLTDPNHFTWAKTTLLIAGLSEGMQGFSELDNVQDEVTSISYLTEKSVVLLDKDFTVERFSENLQKNPFSIVHIASHAQFDSDPRKTFLLTYEGNLTMNKLEQLIRLGNLRDEPMALLTLSACQTAVGDDQAALGLAGVAIKAGARSALATLWFIDDKATNMLIKNFYEQLKKNGLSKAKALQNAQKFLFKTERYKHPAFWAPFLLIGNWL